MKKILIISLLFILAIAGFFILAGNAQAALDIITTSPLPPGTKDSAYPPLQFQATGATTYTWQAFGWGTGDTGICGTSVVKNLPPGLTLNPQGLLSGTPTQEGNFAFAVLVNGEVVSGKNRFCLRIDAPAGTTPTSLQIISPFPGNSTNQNPYNHRQKAAGGTMPYSWVFVGDKPSWLSLSTENNEGVLSGTPSQEGTYTFTLRVQDSRSDTQIRQFSITINPGTAPIGPGITQIPRTNCPTIGLVPCGTASCPCQFCDFFVMFNNIVKFVMFRLAPIIATLMLVIGGVMFLTAGAKPETLSQAKGIITSVVIGLVIIFTAWVIVNTILTKSGILAPTSGLLQWYNIGCSAPTQ